MNVIVFRFFLLLKLRKMWIIVTTTFNQTKVTLKRSDQRFKNNNNKKTLPPKQNHFRFCFGSGFLTCHPQSYLTGFQNFLISPKYLIFTEFPLHDKL